MEMVVVTNDGDLVEEMIDRMFEAMCPHDENDECMVEWMAHSSPAWLDEDGVLWG